MKQPLDFQSIMMTLQEYWAKHNCLIWQPYYSQVGAGTMNPATALRVLGPEPWRVGYVEPSIRPDDGRYGDNPNRLQQHYQFQVILKPDPGNPQEMYLESLEALGIVPRDHDIRFVEDNWEAPPLAAWGLGWEVWLNGQEITQFTYFQQAGGVELDPVSVEITYGLERIAIALQRVGGFRDIRWVDDLTYGDVNLAAEQEHSTYYFEVADVERLYEMFELYEKESYRSLDAGLVLPAYDYLLKCSHSFNVLDTRGAIGVTDRQEFFGRMRALFRQVAEAYVIQREEQGYPWLADERVPKGPRREAPDITNELAKLPDSRSTFLLEVGTEELPPGDMEDALEQLREGVPKMLEDLRLEHGEVRILGTPRRLVVSVDALAPRQPDQERVFRGPPADRAYDTDGSPTRAAQGFARSRGVDVGALQVREIEGGRYVVAAVEVKGRSSLEVLGEALPDLIAGLKFRRSMRWNHTNVAFSRPIRWLLALHGESIVPFEFAGLPSGNRTRGLRFHEPQVFSANHPAAYFQSLESQGIILEVALRRERIREEVEALAEKVDGQAFIEPDLLVEVTHLVERPTALRGKFDEAFLELPREVLIAVMKKHLRYFPVEKEGRLLPYFITVRNGDDRSLENVRDGNEHVVGARFADADFFVKNDLKRPLEDFLPDLDRLRFQADLGSMLDKTHRIVDLVGALAPKLGLTTTEEAHARRAATLCKADLTTEMVVEMTSLQGIMGRYYALKSGETDRVAQAIFEHYLPRFAGDKAPESREGLAVGLADRLDSLAGLFAAGLAPTGSKDPFGLRRAALGLVQNLRSWDMDFDLRSALRAAAKRQPIEVAPKVQAEVLDFIGRRIQSMLLEEGYPFDVVEAVVAAQAHNPASAVDGVAQLEQWTARQDWNEILPAYSRCVRIVRDQPEIYPVDPELIEEPAAKALFEALKDAESVRCEVGSVDDFLHAFLPMIPAVNRFFDEVLVMAEDSGLRKNRLGLLQRIAALADGAADMSRLEGF